MSSSTQTNPLLLSTENIIAANSIAFTVIYALLFVVLAVRLIRKPVMTFAYVLMTLFAALRVVTFAMRYDVTKTSVSASNFQSIVTGAGVTLIAGFYLFIEAVMDLVYKWWLDAHDKHPSKNHMILSHIIRHIILVIASIIGIIGAVKESDAISENLSASKLTQYKDMRIASGALFIIITALLFLITLYLFFRTPNAPAAHPVRVTVLLAILSACTNLESVYRVCSANTFSGWIITEQSVDVLIFMPELIALLIMCVFDFSVMGDITFWNGRPKAIESKNQQTYPMAQRDPQYTV